MIPPKGKMTRRDMMRLSSGLVVLPVLSACGDGAGRSQAAEYSIAAEYISPRDSELITEVAELIIPQTDTPGAKAARVPEFIGMLLQDWYAPAERDSFIALIGQFNIAAQAAGHERFMTSPAEAKIAVLEAMEASPTPESKAAFDEMKRLTVWGYYTSEAATEELTYDPIPGRYDGCADMTEIDRAYLITGI